MKTVDVYDFLTHREVEKEQQLLVEDAEEALRMELTD